MRLYKQELKRILLTKRTKIIFVIAIVISIMFALQCSRYPH